MLQLDEYIDSILANMNMSHGERAEMKEEFKDHLLLLKQEFIDAGFTEKEAEAQAIRCFGDSKAIKSGLARAITGYRSVFNIIIGFLISALIYMVSVRIPVPGVSWDQVENVNVIIQLVFGICAILLFMPIGYYTPIIFKRACSLFHVVMTAGIASALLSTLCVGTGYFELKYIPVIILGGLVGSMVGFGVLNIVDKIVRKIVLLRV